MVHVTDLIVTTDYTEEGMDSVVQALPGSPAAVVQGSMENGTCKVRVFGDAGFM